MRLKGPEHIEIAHDALAAKVYDKASPLERQRLEAERLVRDAFRQYHARGKMLDRSDLRLLRPVLDRLQLEPEELAYVQRSRNRLRARRSFLIGGAVMVALLLAFLWDANRREVMQRRLAQANRWVYLANHYSGINQLDSALLFAGAAFRSSAPNHLPAAQRMLVEAFHKGLEGIPLRQERHPISGDFSDYKLLIGQQQILIAYEDGRLVRFDLDTGAETELTRGAYIEGLALHPNGERALAAVEDTLLHIDPTTGTLTDRSLKQGILLEQGFWVSAGGSLSVTEDSLYFRSLDDGVPDWKRALPNPGSFAVDAALAPQATYAAVLAANDTIYRFDATGKALAPLAAPAELIDIGILAGDNLFLLGESQVWFADAEGLLRQELVLPPLPNLFFEPEVALEDPGGSPHLYLNLGRSLVRLAADGAYLDTVSTYDTLYMDLVYSPEREAAIDLRTRHLIRLETDRARRLMTLPAFAGMDYEESTGSLVMLQDTTLNWWKFTFGPYQERRAVASLYLPTDDTAPLLTVENGQVYRRAGPSVQDWEPLAFPETIAHTVVNSRDLSIYGLSADGSLYHFAENSIRQIFQVSSGEDWEPFILHDTILGLRERSGDELHLWNPAENDFQTFEYDGVIQDMDYHLDNRLLALAGSNDDVILLDAREDTIGHLLGHGRDVLDVDFSPNGRLIATASGDRDARLWNVRGDLLHVLDGHAGFVNAVQFAPDGQTLATASADFSLRLWETRTGRLLYQCYGHEGPVLGVVFATDGQSFLSWSTDGTARLWNLQGEPLGVYGYPERQDPIVRAEFSPDGEGLITHSRGDRLRTWLTPAAITRWLQAHYELDEFLESVR